MKSLASIFSDRALLVLVTCGVGWHIATGRDVVANPPPQPQQQQQTVPLPYTFRDDTGMQWDVQADGSIGPGGADVFDSGGRLFLDQGAQYAATVQQAKFDAHRNELALAPAQIAGLTVNRHVTVNVHNGWCRWVDVFENRGATPHRVTVRLNFDLGAANQGMRTISGAKRDDRPIGAAIFDGNRGIAFLFAGRTAAGTRPTLTTQNGSDQIDIASEIDVPARQSVALVHLVAVRNTIDEAQAFFEKARESEFLADLPRELRARVVNFPRARQSLGDWELIRDELLDVVELRGGDQFKGTLLDTRFTAQTAYGPVELTSDRLAAILAIGEFHPDYLLVGSDGQAFCGTLQTGVLRLQLTSGQVTSVPLSSVKRVGWRKRAGDPEDFKYDRPMLALRSGDRLLIERPRGPFALATRMGTLRLPSEVVAAIDFQPADVPHHEVELIDGSRLFGIVTSDPIEFSTIALGPSRPLQFSVGSLARLQLAPAGSMGDTASTTTRPATAAATTTNASADESDLPRLSLGSGGDQLVGALSGRLSLDTSFDTIDVQSAEIAGLRRTGDASAEVQITLGDGQLLSGRIRGDAVNCVLQCGVPVKVPVSLIEEYVQPFPQPPPKVFAEVTSLVAQLSGPDVVGGDRAAEALRKMGPRISGALRTLRADQTAATQARLDEVLASFKEQRSPQPTRPAAPPQQEAAPATADAPDPAEIPRR